MYFTNLAQDYAAYNSDSGKEPENKQRVSLSEQALEILRHDHELLGEPGKENKDSTMVNQVFLSMYQQAEASVEHQLCGRLEEMRELLGADFQEQLCLRLLAPIREQLQKRTTQRLARKGRSFSIRLNHDTLLALVEPDCQKEGVFYGDRIGKYLKAIVEEYAEHPYVERERIYCGNNLEQVQLAIDTGKVLKITLRSRSTSNLPNKEYMKVAGIYQDQECLYNYLVGFHSVNNTAPWSITSIRLSSISSCKVRCESGKLTKSQLTEIQNRIDEKGIQYLADEKASDRIAVRLTKEGEKNYRKILHLRPVCVGHDPNDPSIYYFNCSAFQAEIYFFPYGHNAEMLEPQSLREKFIRRYESALDRYK